MSPTAGFAATPPGGHLERDLGYSGGAVSGSPFPRQRARHRICLMVYIEVSRGWRSSQCQPQYLTSPSTGLSGRSSREEGSSE